MVDETTESRKKNDEGINPWICIEYEHHEIDNVVCDIVSAKPIIEANHAEGAIPSCIYECDCEGKETKDGTWYGCEWRVSIVPLDRTGESLTFSKDELKSLGWTEHQGSWAHPLTPGIFDFQTAVEVSKRAAQGYTGNGDDWTPSAADIAWQEKLLANTPDGQLWQTSTAVFQVWHDRKAYFVAGRKKGEEHHADRVIEVFRAMGWVQLSEPVVPGAEAAPDQMVMLCHKPEDKESAIDGVATQCTICNCALICTQANADKLNTIAAPICFECAKKGPEEVRKALDI